MDPRWAGRSFGFEPLRGLRSWHVGDSGILTSGFDGFAWTPGDNEAHCNRKVTRGELSDRLGTDRTNWPGAGDQSFLQFAAKALGHDMVTCSCGFHALTDESQIGYYRGHGNVIGLLEGYGEVVEGTQGFRASRGRVVALVAPGGIQAPLRGIDAWRKRWDGLPKWRIVAMFVLYALLAFHMTTIPFFSADAIAYGVLTYQVMKRGTMMLIAALPGVEARRQWPGDLPVDKIKEHYPGVKLYDSVAAMLAAHPLSVPSTS